MNTILVPTDFSDCAEYALKYACQLAKKTKARIVLLHVMTMGKNLSEQSTEGDWMGGWAGASAGVAAPLMIKLLKDTKRKMSKLKDASFCNGVKIQDTIEMGKISESINLSVTKHKADIIVMGTHGAKGLVDVFAGSNAEKVVRDAEVPVLSIQPGKGKVEIKRILFATDFSNETTLVFPYIRRFADYFGAEIHLVKIVDDEGFKERNLAKKDGENFLKDNNLGNYPVAIIHHVRSKSEAMSRFAELNEMDVIALGTHGRHGLAHFLKGSIAEDVVNHSFTPVLTVNLHKKLLDLAGQMEGKKKKGLNNRT